MGRNLSNKYGQKRLNNAKRSTTDAITTASKRATQKTSEATAGNKIADKITSPSKRSPKELQLTKWGWNRNTKGKMIKGNIAKMIQMIT